MNLSTLQRSPALRAGVGLFETMLVIRDEPIMLRHHARRMIEAAREMGVAAPGEEQFVAAARVAPDHATPAERAVRLDWLAVGDDLADPSCWMLATSHRPLPPLTVDRRAGCRLVVLPAIFRRAAPAWKTTSYLPCVLGLRRAEAEGANEALFADYGGELLEGTSTNLFLTLADGSLATPRADGSILPGVTRKWVIETALECGVRVHERPCSLDELRSGGGFVTGSLTGLAAVTLVNGEVAPPPVAETIELLQRRWSELLAQP